MNIFESSIGTMSRDWKMGEHGKEHTDAQHKKRKASGRWKVCNTRVGVEKKERWNKKKGIKEKSKKHSKLISWLWCK